MIYDFKPFVTLLYLFHNYIEAIEESSTFKLNPPIVPVLAHDHDTSYFDRNLTSKSIDYDVWEVTQIE